MTFDRAALRSRYVEERPHYEALARYVCLRVQEATAVAGIKCALDDRAKDVARFLKKALRKVQEGQYDPDRPIYDQIQDKAGVRVAVAYHADLARVDTVIRELFPIIKTEDKQLSLGYSELGYLGVHYEVTLPHDQVLPVDDALRGLVCEIQVHTRAQSLWATVTHELSYKPAQPPEERVLRMLYRLLALIELFDDQVERAREELLNQPGFSQASLLDLLEKHFYQFTGKEFDRLLSLEIIGDLEPLWEQVDDQSFGSQLDAFVDQNRDKIGEIFEHYADDDHNLLISQPESLLVFCQLDRDPFRLKAVWEQSLPLDLLESLALAWGKSI